MMNYPPGHPTGHSTTYEDRRCERCGEYYRVTITNDYSTNAGGEVGSCPCPDINIEEEEEE